MSQIYEEILRMQRAGEPCALCTIVKTQGSTPGKDAMKMLVRRDGSFAGTVGGGCLEAEVLEAALESMQDERSRSLSFSLNERDYPDSGLLCGGQVEIFVEPITQPRLVLFGGGHVAKAVARLAVEVGFHVTVGDDRAAFVTADSQPHAHERIAGPMADLAKNIAPAEGMYVLAVTRGHDEDGAVLKALFESDCKPKYLAMIGSKRKRVEVFRMLGEQGVAQDFLEQVESPMGIPIGARTHEEIAVSVVARMIAVRRVPTPKEG